MATITVSIPDDLLETPKSPEQMAEDARLAVLMFWLARGLVKRDKLHLATIRKRELPDLGEPVPVLPGAARKRGLKEILLAMPNVGEDADFARLPDEGREQPEWGT